MIELLLAQYPTVPVGERNSDEELPIRLLLEHSDQENSGYMSSMFLLLRANPEMWMDDIILCSHWQLSCWALMSIRIPR